MAVVLRAEPRQRDIRPGRQLGGILSVVMIAAIVLAINFAPVPNKGTLALGLARWRCWRWSLFYRAPEAREVPAV